MVAYASESGERALVAYCVGGAALGDQVAPRDKPALTDAVRAALALRLPDYLVPTAYVWLDALPVTANGKIDHAALPDPGGQRLWQVGYEPPEGDIEVRLAEIWADLLGRERIGRRDNFFELGGHSLLALTLRERLRTNGFVADVSGLFNAPTLADLAASVVRAAPDEPQRPAAGALPADADRITPDMLPLVALEQSEIDLIVASVPGGAANLQDVYPLAPMQEGVLFHHLLTEHGDPYLLSIGQSFDSRDRLQGYLTALQAVVDRHDILRTAVFWEGLSQPVQVVWRRAPLPVVEVTPDAGGGDALARLRARFDPRELRLDIRHAPMLRIYTAYDAARDRWVLLMLSHHLMDDNTTFKAVFAEIQAILCGEADLLPQPLPFRDFVAESRAAADAEGDARFFTALLGDITEPTAPLGLTDIGGDGSGVAECEWALDPGLVARLRTQAGASGVSAASVCHVAWGLVLARLTGRRDVVFGTVLFGRMAVSGSVGRALGPFINTLPVRLTLDGRGVGEAVRQTHGVLAELLRHEHASLALAQRCSGVPAPAPLFTSLFNYRHSDMADPRPWDGITWEFAQERTNYPLMLAIDDRADGLHLSVQAVDAVDPVRVGRLVECALGAVVAGLEQAPDSPVGLLDVLPSAERESVVSGWNDTAVDVDLSVTVPELFLAQVASTPDAVAVVCGSEVLTYRELGVRAGRVASRLRGLGVKPGVLVAVSMPRGVGLLACVFGVLLAGGAYVPVDPDLGGPAAAGWSAGCAAGPRTAAGSGSRPRARRPGHGSAPAPARSAPRTRRAARGRRGATRAGRRRRPTATRTPAPGSRRAPRPTPPSGPARTAPPRRGRAARPPPGRRRSTSSRRPPRARWATAGRPAARPGRPQVVLEPAGHEDPHPVAVGQAQAHALGAQQPHAVAGDHLEHLELGLRVTQGTGDRHEPGHPSRVGGPRLGMGAPLGDVEVGAHDPHHPPRTVGDGLPPGVQPAQRTVGPPHPELHVDDADRLDRGGQRGLHPRQVVGVDRPLDVADGAGERRTGQPVHRHAALVPDQRVRRQVPVPQAQPGGLQRELQARRVRTSEAGPRRGRAGHRASTPHHHGTAATGGEGERSGRQRLVGQRDEAAVDPGSGSVSKPSAASARRRSRRSIAAPHAVGCLTTATWSRPSRSCWPPGDDDPALDGRAAAPTHPGQLGPGGMGAPAPSSCSGRPASVNAAASSTTRVTAGRPRAGPESSPNWSSASPRPASQARPAGVPRSSNDPSERRTP